MVKSIGLVLVTLAAAGVFAGCGPSGDPPAARAAEGATSDKVQSRNARLLAAAEPYEGLTESAFAQPFAELEAIAATARAAAIAADDFLGDAEIKELAALDAEIKDSLQSQSRTGVALGAVESYKILVSAQDDSAAIPIDVSLLDYAGFRFDALSKSTPPSWVAMTETAAYALDLWGQMRPRVAEPALVSKFDAALGAMGAAVESKDVAAAQSSAQQELALVDELESYFARN